MKTLTRNEIDTSEEQELKLRRNLQVAFDEMIGCPTGTMGMYEICCMHYERAKRALDNLLLSRPDAV